MKRPIQDTLWVEEAVSNNIVPLPDFNLAQSNIPLELSAKADSSKETF